MHQPGLSLERRYVAKARVDALRRTLAEHVTVNVCLPPWEQARVEREARRAER